MIRPKSQNWLQHGRGHESKQREKEKGRTTPFMVFDVTYIVCKGPKVDA